MRVSQERRKLFQELRTAGVQITVTRGGHVMLLAPCGARCYVASTPSDSRDLANVRALIRRALKISQK